MSEEHGQPSEALFDLAWVALQHGVASVEDGGPLVPFLVGETADGRALQRFAAMADEDDLDLEASIAQARQHLRASSNARRVALAYDGYVTAEGTRFDAILVEAQDRGSPSAFTFAQRYQQNPSASLVPIGDPMLLGPAEPILG